MTKYLPEYLHHGRDILPEQDRVHLARVIAVMKLYGVTQAEIARLAGLNKARITRVIRPEIKKATGYRCNISLAYAEAVWRGVDRACTARSLNLKSIRAIARKLP